ncbi:MAG TPA: UPF0236 family protein [Candidatus Aphodovivens avicola]|nr:UPF0236 family protein [Candidatus Aphodovivens avicola]
MPDGAPDTDMQTAIDSLANIFWDILSSRDGITFEEFEERALTCGHGVMAQAIGAALERYDAELCADLPSGQHIHDKRRRTLITEVGDVTFTQHRVRGADGTYAPLSEALGIPGNRQISPGALSFLAEAGAELSYASAAHLLARKGGSQVSAMTAMRALRQAVEESDDGAPSAASPGSSASASPAASSATPAGKARRRAARRKHGQSLARTSEQARLNVFQQNRPHASMRGVIAFNEADIELFQDLCRSIMERRGMTGNGFPLSPIQPSKGVAMGSYEREQQMIAAGTADRGYTAKKYFEELDAELTEETSSLSHRPDYSKTLFAPENDDIYREFCAYVDLPKPRFFDAIPDPIRVEGFSAADVYFAMKSKNPRIVEIDGAAVYNMLVKLRTQPEISKKVLDFIPTCYQGGCGKGDAAFERGYYDNK